MRMRWGKHLGKDLEELPDAYLAWLIDARQDWVQQKFPELHHAVVDEITRRGAEMPRPEILLQIINSGYRTLARAAHPDAGGRTIDMQALNNAVAWLRAAVRKLME